MDTELVRRISTSLVRINKNSHEQLLTLATEHKRTIKGELEYLIEQEYIHLSISGPPVAAHATT